ncbi:MAG TPA: DUF4232 domain-containing protein [Dehalococcoidia bacterium]|jgi:hypothetical protein|nr:DUF4232 domain-containing protein [Dehalococcoidia bacterium]
MRVVLAVVAFLAIIAVACGGDDEQATPSPTRTAPEPTPIPWVDATHGPSPSPSQYPSPAPADLAVRACTGDEVRGEISGSNGAAGNNLVYLSFSNISATPCRLEGAPEGRLVDASGATLQASVKAADCFWEQEVECAARLVSVLQPDTPDADRALMVTSFPNQPAQCDKVDATFVLTLPDNAGELSIPYGQMDSCGTLTYGRFLPPARPTGTPAPPFPLTAALHLPAAVSAGTTLLFTAEITNNGSTPFDFGDLCPNYSLIIGAKVAGGNYLLNCQPARQIAAGETAVFQMQAGIPSTAAPGEYYVDWVLDGTTYQVGAGRSSLIEKTPYTIEVVAAPSS